MRIRRSTGPGASPLPGYNENHKKQTRTRSRWICAVVLGQSVCKRSAGALPLTFVVSIPRVTFGGDR